MKIQSELAYKPNKRKRQDESPVRHILYGRKSNRLDIDVSEAQDAITSIIKAFDIDTDDIESVMDKLVTTGKVLPDSVATRYKK